MSGILTAQTVSRGCAAYINPESRPPDSGPGAVGPPAFVVAGPCPYISTPVNRNLDKVLKKKKPKRKLIAALWMRADVVLRGCHFELVSSSLVLFSVSDEGPPVGGGGLLRCTSMLSTADGVETCETQHV